jgi:hypothetical protein
LLSSSPQRLYGSLDGAHAPLNEEWREMKTGCWYEVDTIPKDRVPQYRQAQVAELGALCAKNIAYDIVLLSEPPNEGLSGGAVLLCNWICPKPTNLSRAAYLTA